MPDDDLCPKVELSQAEKERNKRIFFKILEAILFPVLIGALFEMNIFACIIGAIWLIADFISFFYDPEKLLITVILEVLGIGAR